MPASDPDKQLSSWFFDLPDDRIARRPVEPRSASRLLVVAEDGAASHHSFVDLPELLDAGTLVIVNDTRVLPARLRGRKEGTGGVVELLLLGAPGPDSAEALVKPGRRLAPGARVVLDGAKEGKADPAPIVIVGERLEGGARRLTLDGGARWPEVLLLWGALPLPPYLERPADERDDQHYQSVFASNPGAVAAPTASLHFDRGVLDALRARGVVVAPLTLHVGGGTFLPVRHENLDDHPMHEEPYFVPASTAALLVEAIESGRRILCVGTTAMRAAESWWRAGRPADGGWCRTSLFLRPGAGPQGPWSLLTNFHLPGSTLLMLVGSLRGRQFVLDCYAQAMRAGYRFYSYGDAMLWLRAAAAP